MIDKIILALRIAGWACFAMAVISFVGIMDYFGCGGNDVMYRLRHVKTGKCVTNKVFGL